MTTNKPGVKRYKLDYGYDSMMRQFNRMQESEGGVYVRFDDYEALQAENEALRAREAALVEALEEIAQSCDSGRHDGLPEDGPALDDVEAWLVANDALAAHLNSVAPTQAGRDYGKQTQ